MFLYRNTFQNEDEIQALVQAAEKNYIDQVLKIANEISDFSHHIKFLTLAGPTCSGKTTTSYILEREFEKRNNTVKIISIDDFYRDRSDISDDKKPDYESISAIDFPIFEDCVKQILSGQTAMLPIFDFKTGTRSGFVPYVPNDHEIIIFEGIQAIYPEIVGTLPKDISKSIYISVDEDVTVYDTTFEKKEIRFFRRLVRDYLFRNASPSRTLDLWDGVVENENKNIIRYGKKADYIINSFLAYELSVITPFLLKTISYDMDKENERTLYNKIIKEFKNIPEIPSHFVPDDSFFREFIGPEKQNSI